MAGTERTQRELLCNCSRPDHNIKRDLVGNVEKLKYMAMTVKKIDNQTSFFGLYPLPNFLNKHDLSEASFASVFRQRST